MSESTYELKDGKFSLFKVENKSKENSPDFTGKGMFDGMEFRLSAWARKSNTGKMYLSGSIQHPQGQQSAPVATNEVDDFIGAPPAADDGPGPLLDNSPPPPDKPKKTKKQVEDESSDLPFILTIPLAAAFVLKMIVGSILLS